MGNQVRLGQNGTGKIKANRERLVISNQDYNHLERKQKQLIECN